MRKFYTLLVLLLVATISISAQSAKTKQSHNPKALTERQKEIVRAKKSIASLRSTKQQQQTFEPDSAYVYSGDGQLIEKTYFTFANEGRDVSQDEYEWDAEKKEFVLDWKDRRIVDERGNQLMWEEMYRDSSTDQWGGEKNEFKYDSADKEISSIHHKWSADLDKWLLSSSWVEEAIAGGGYQIINESLYYENNEVIEDGSKRVEKFDAKGLELSRHHYSWSVEEKKWVDDYSYTEWAYTYAANGKPESKIRYDIFSDNPGVKVYQEKCEYKYVGDNVSEELRFFDYNGDGILEKGEKVIYGYDAKNKEILNERYRWSADANEIYDWRKDRKTVMEYDTRGNRTSKLSYNSDSDLDVWVFSYKEERKYDSKDNETYEASYSWELNESTGQYYWRGRYRQINTFSAEGYDIFYQEQQWDEIRNDWGFGYKGVLEIDSNGRPTIGKEYDWENGQWVLDEYTIYFPYSPDNEIEVEESKPINDDNEASKYEGKFTLGLNIASNALPTGTFDIILPEGFTLDEAATKLSSALAGKANLKLTQDSQNKNKWTATITATTFRSAGKVVYKSIVDIAYKVSETAATQKSEILVKDLNIALSTGGSIVKDELKVLVAPKDVSSIEKEVLADRVVTFVGGVLRVDTPDAETVNVYTVAGMQICSIEKPAGEVNHNIGEASGSVIIVRGSTGWVQKLIAK